MQQVKDFSTYSLVNLFLGEKNREKRKARKPPWTVQYLFSYSFPLLCVSNSEILSVKINYLFFIGWVDSYARARLMENRTLVFLLETSHSSTKLPPWGKKLPIYLHQNNYLFIFIKIRSYTFLLFYNVKSVLFPTFMTTGTKVG